MSKFLPKAALLAFLLISLNQVPLAAQQQSTVPEWEFAELVDWSYGQDQELVNGLQYYNRHPRSLGHPYLLEGWVHQGNVTLRGRLYTGLWLKYDIYQQHLEVEYGTMSGADNQVILVSDRVNDFSIGHNYFERLSLDGEHNEERFYQVLGGGSLVLYIQWEKKLVPKSGDSRFIEEYTSAKRNYFLNLDGTVRPFSSKKGFVQLFPEAVQKDIKRLIKSNQLQIRTASAEQLELFMMAAGSFLGGVQ